MKKKQVAKQQEKATAFYVGVSNSTEIRKSMLETSKELLVSLKQYEHLREIRAQKAAMYSQYNAQISAVKSLILKLQRAIPKHDLSHLVAKEEPVAVIRAAPEPVVVKAEPVAQVEKLPRGATAAMDEVTRLETELAAIEAKLSGM